MADGRLYCIGGRHTSHHLPGDFAAFFGAVTPEVDVYHFAKRQWTTLSEKLPVPTAAGGLIEHAAMIYYISANPPRNPPTPKPKSSR